jgi:hypothetical protein
MGATRMMIFLPQRCAVPRRMPLPLPTAGAVGAAGAPGTFVCGCVLPSPAAERTPAREGFLGTPRHGGKAPGPPPARAPPPLPPRLASLPRPALRRGRRRHPSSAAAHNLLWQHRQVNYSPAAGCGERAAHGKGRGLDGPRGAPGSGLSKLWPCCELPSPFRAPHVCLLREHHPYCRPPRGPLRPPRPAIARHSRPGDAGRGEGAAPQTGGAPGSQARAALQYPRLQALGPPDGCIGGSRSPFRGPWGPPRPGRSRPTDNA